MTGCERLFSSNPTPLNLSVVGSAYALLHPVAIRNGLLTSDPTEIVEYGTVSSDIEYQELLILEVDVATIINVEKKVDSCFLDLAMKGSVVPGMGPGTGSFRILVSSDGDINNAENLSDEISVGIEEKDYYRSGSIILEKMEKLPFFLHVVGKVDDPADEIKVGISSNTEIELLYHIS